MKQLDWMVRNNSFKWHAITQGVRFYIKISWRWICSTVFSPTLHSFMSQPRRYRECSRSFRVASSRMVCSSVRIHIDLTARDGQTIGTVVFWSMLNGDGLWSRPASLSWSITTAPLEDPGNYSRGLLRFGAKYSLDRTA